MEYALFCFCFPCILSEGKKSIFIKYRELLKYQEKLNELLKISIENNCSEKLDNKIKSYFNNKLAMSGKDILGAHDDFQFVYDHIDERIKRAQALIEEYDDVCFEEGYGGPAYEIDTTDIMRVKTADFLILIWHLQ